MFLLSNYVRGISALPWLLLTACFQSYTWSVSLSFSFKICCHPLNLNLEHVLVLSLQLSA